MEADPSLLDIKVAGLQLLGCGVSGGVYALDQDTVVKKAPKSENEYCDKQFVEDHLIERSIYERLGDHPRIYKYYYPVRRGLVLERLDGPLRKCLLDLANSKQLPSPKQAMKWSIQTAQGLSYLHQKAVLQADLGCHNLLLNQRDEVKFCDFGGSSIDGQPPTVCYESRSQSYLEEGKPPSVGSELFALGSTIYEIWTTKQPYRDMSDVEVRELYKSNRFPDLDGIPAAGIIKKCWLGAYSSAVDVVSDLESLRSVLEKSRGKDIHSRKGSWFTEKLPYSIVGLPYIQERGLMQ